MRILLINSLSSKLYKAYFPLGLSYIAGVLLQQGHEITVWDMNVENMSKKQALNKIKNELSSYELIGISALAGDYPNVKWTVRQIKNIHPGLKIMLGGCLATALPQFLMNNLPIDFIVAGEGEYTVVELVEELNGGSNFKRIKGLFYRDNSGNIVANPQRSRSTNLDKLPLPPWDLFPMNTYFENPYHSLKKNTNRDRTGSEGVVPIMASRGCPFDCIYCNHMIKGYIPRYRPVKSVVDEIKQILAKYKNRIDSFYFWDDIFIWNESWVTEFCKTVLKENLKIKWTCNGHVKKINRQLIASIKSAGCVNIRFGIESGSQYILDGLNKHVKVKKAVEALKICMGAGLTVTIYIMVGMTGENHETINETIRFFEKLITPFNVCQIRKVHFFMLTPFPGTRLYEKAKKEGLLKNDEDFFKRGCDANYDIPLNISGLTDRSLLKLKRNLEDNVGRIIEKNTNHLHNILLDIKRVSM